MQIVTELLAVPAVLDAETLASCPPAEVPEDSPIEPQCLTKSVSVQTCTNTPTLKRNAKAQVVPKSCCKGKHHAVLFVDNAHNPFNS